MSLSEKERFILKSAALTKGGIKLDESFRPTINNLQKRKLIYIVNRIVRITFKGYCVVGNLPSWCLDNCAKVPKHADNDYISMWVTFK
tara:strand:- start:25403 stop:25666 length:264 start_codon:yes stop_codon:yes gene_type:complete